MLEFEASYLYGIYLCEERGFPWVGSHVESLHRLVHANSEASKQALPMEACNA